LSAWRTMETPFSMARETAICACMGSAAVVAYVIYFKSIGEIGATRTAAYNTLLPPLAVLIATITLGERLTPLQALGAMVVVSGVILARFAPAKLPWAVWPGLASRWGSRWPRFLPRGAGRSCQVQISREEIRR
jgi:drug/metabolite transporter (DMT)-like permease